MSNFNKFFPYLLPHFINIIYLLIKNKFFTKGASFEKNPTETNLSKRRIIIEAVKTFVRSRGFKIAMLANLGVGSWNYFYPDQEFEELLVTEVLKLCLPKEDEEIFCNLLNLTELELHSLSFKELIIAENVENIKKIDMIKIRLDFLINHEGIYKWRFLLISSIAVIISLCGSGTAAIALFMQALSDLLKEGKISKTMYDILIKIIQKHLQ